MRSLSMSPLPCFRRAPRRARSRAAANRAGLAGAGLLVWAIAATAAGPAPVQATSPATPAKAAPAAPAKTAAPVARPAPVDVNRATRAQLVALPGIGPADADRIIAARPYRSRADLAERGVLPRGVVVSLKSRLIAIPPPDLVKRNGTAS
jgi:competence protein ComEA